MKNSSMGQSKKIVTTVTYAALILGSLVMIFPFLWMILTSSKTVPESMQIPPTIFPAQITFENFTRVMESLPFVSLYWNTEIGRAHV